MNRGIRLGLSVVALSAAFFAAAGIARADELNLDAEVVCQKGGNIALIRFISAWNEDPPAYRRLPPSVDGGLSAARPSKRQNCTMANGSAVRIRSGEMQAYAYGMGGADPPAFFSLWVDRRKVLSRKQWKPGYADDTSPWLVAVVVRPNRLTICSVAQNSDAPQEGKIDCRDKPLRLARYKIDRVEYAPPGTKLPVGTRLVMPGSGDPKLCQQFLGLHRKNWPETYEMVDSAKIFGPEAAPTVPYILEGIIEVAPGVRRKLISWSGDSHYFDADLIFLAPVTADAKAVLKDELLENPEEFPVKKLPRDWHLISGQQPDLYPEVSWRYVHFGTQRLNGRIYLLAQPTNWSKKPAAILVEPTASGHRVVCRFDRVDPNF